MRNRHAFLAMNTIITWTISTIRCIIPKFKFISNITVWCWTFINTFSFTIIIVNLSVRAFQITSYSFLACNTKVIIKTFRAAFWTLCAFIKVFESSNWTRKLTNFKYFIINKRFFTFFNAFICLRNEGISSIISITWKTRSFNFKIARIFNTFVINC